MPKSQSSSAIKAVATFEALKGVVAFAAASGALLLVHRDLHQLALRLVEFTHLNPASKYPSIFITAASHLQEPRILMLAAGAALYCLARFIESYGLFRGAAWAEVFAAVSGGIYVPLEVIAVIREPDWLRLAVLAINILVVWIAVRALLQRRRARSSHAA